MIVEIEVDTLDQLDAVLAVEPRPGPLGQHGT